MGLFDNDKKGAGAANKAMASPQNQQLEYNRGRLGRLGSLVGGIAGTLIPIPGVGSWLGAGLGSLIGNSAGQLISGGRFDPVDAVTAGVGGGIGGVAGSALGPVVGQTAGNVGGQVLGQGIAGQMNPPPPQPQPNPMYAQQMGLAPIPQQMRQRGW